MYNNNDLQNSAPPSLCIPCVDQSLSSNEIKSVIDGLQIGDIKKIDVVPLKNSDKNLNRVFIHFYKWNKDDRVQTIYRTLKSGNCIKVIHNDPWFWKVSLSKFNS
jgi:hypothetical protein